MNDEPIDTTATEIMDSGYVEVAEITQLDRIEAKTDQCLAILLELVTWKTQVEEAMQEVMAKGPLAMLTSGFGGLFGK